MCCSVSTFPNSPHSLTSLKVTKCSQILLLVVPLMNTTEKGWGYPWLRVYFSWGTLYLSSLSCLRTGKPYYRYYSLWFTSTRSLFSSKIKIPQEPQSRQTHQKKMGKKRLRERERGKNRGKEYGREKNKYSRAHGMAPGYCLRIVNRGIGGSMKGPLYIEAIRVASCSWERGGAREI